MLGSFGQSLGVEHPFALEQIIGLLENSKVWKGIHICYEYPRIDRIWCDVKPNLRLCFHDMFPNPIGKKSYYHAHPWAFETIIINGAYFSDTGATSVVDRNQNVPLVTKRILITEGSWYKIDNPNLWHTVEPVRPTTSVVLIKRNRDKKWPKQTPKSCTDNPPMDNDAVETLRNKCLNIVNEKSNLLIQVFNALAGV